MKERSSCVRGVVLLEVDEVCRGIVNQSKGAGQRRSTADKDGCSTRRIIPSEHQALPVSPSTDSESDVYPASARLRTRAHQRRCS